MHIGWFNRFIRMVFQGSIVFLLLTLTFLFICFLNILAPPLSNSDLDTSAYTEADISISTNSEIVESWCLKNYSSSSQ